MAQKKADTKSISRIKKELMDHIANLHEARCRVGSVTLARTRTDLRRQRREADLSGLEAAHTLAVCNEKDENGKAIFSNETMRRMEVANRVAKDDSMLNLTKFINSAKWRASTLRSTEILHEAYAERMQWMVKILFLDYAKEIEAIQYVR